MAHFVSAWDGPAKSLRTLCEDIQARQQRLDQRELHVRAHRAPIDLSALRQRVSERRFDELSRREWRLIVSRFEGFPPDDLAVVLQKDEGLWRRFCRALLMAWGRTDIFHWAQYVQLSRAAPESAWGLGANFPLRGHELIASDGPARLAALWATWPLRKILDELESARLRPTWDIAGQVAAEWLREQARVRSPKTEMGTCLLEDPRCLGWLPQSPKEKRLSSSVRTQAAVIGAALECRRERLFTNTEELRLDDRLLTPGSTFGDPRTGASAGWLEVKALSPKAYAEFLASLIREDLQFFFDNAMQEPDRRSFWLRYLGSIQQTICVLDRTTWSAMCKRVAALPLPLQSAFRRSKRFDKDGVVSAFCLIFDRHVIVEFSMTGNASYVYPRSTFDEVITRDRFYDESALKNGNRAVKRLTHRTGWEPRFEEVLREFEIFPDGWRRTRFG